MHRCNMALIADRVSSSDLHCYGEVQIERGRTEAGVTVIGACLTSKGLLVEG